jgi:hypothetical protein
MSYFRPVPALGNPGDILITNSGGTATVFSTLGLDTTPGHISWQSPVDIGSDLSSLATSSQQILQYGWVFTAATGTVGGITFTRSSCDNETSDATGLSFTHADSTFQSMLNGYEYKYSGSGVDTLQLTLTGLTTGESYTVQLFVIDMRSPTGDRGIRFRDPAGNTSSSFKHNAKKYVKGDFVASGTTQVVFIDSDIGGSYYSPGAAVINMVVVRRYATPTTYLNLAQVAINSPTDGQVLKYDASIQKWKNANP